ncbi:hypothetical protein MHB66_08685 [Bacillus sp. FSL L8-0167]|nr:hypothetical protein [Bacillus safensis]MCM3448846.1 hypothetical protein [Bacillus safensis]MDR6681597.1 hypothetical protein [Bacillus safensis]MEC0949761.1 hypothetical protein [Bacillus safensis]MED5092641.1 hypothetical protein [Bacillus safensis]
MRVTKNYTTDGGDRTVIGGVLELAGGKIVKDGEEVSRRRRISCTRKRDT